MEHNKQIQTHFDQEAQEFDEIIQTIIPYYDQMIEAIVASIPFETDQRISVIDLGCGTGTVAHAIQEVYPNATITCVDMSEEMLTIAKQKLNNQAIYIASSFEHLTFEKHYDVVVSSLALHHLEDQMAHQQFYHQIYDALNLNGLFINADVVQASSAELQDAFMQKWISFMNRKIRLKEIQERWLKSHFEEDRPQPLMAELKTLETVGFKAVDIVYKYYNYAVYLGKKS
jgi:tRNA (cmo5U34)-methyltransferase